MVFETHRSLEQKRCVDYEIKLRLHFKTSLPYIKSQMMSRLNYVSFAKQTKKITFLDIIQQKLQLPFFGQPKMHYESQSYCDVTFRSSHLEVLQIILYLFYNGCCSYNVEVFCPKHFLTIFTKHIGC